MRTIDADALKELFSEVIGHIAKKPEMNGNLEHMIRASAMVIQMIDDAPTVQPDTTTHDSIPAKTGKNDGVGTSGDCISRQQAIDALKEKVFHNLSDEFYGAMQVLDELPSVQPETNCSEIPNNSDVISRQAAIDFVGSMNMCDEISNEACKKLTSYLDELPSIQPERKTGHWILDRSGAYCCSKCMEPCAGYVMMKPRDKFCKMCGSRNEVTE